MNSIITPQAQAKQEARRLIELEVSGRYAEEMKRVGFWRRAVIWLKIQKQVQTELNRRFPPHALYIARFAR